MIMRTIAVLLVSAIAAMPAMSGPGDDKAKKIAGPGEDKAQKIKAQKNAKNSAASKAKVEKSQPGDDRPAKTASK